MDGCTDGISPVFYSTLFALRNPLQKLCYLKLRWWGLSSTFKRHQARISMTTGTFYSTQICIFQLSKGWCGFFFSEGMMEFWQHWGTTGLNLRGPDQFFFVLIKKGTRNSVQSWICGGSAPFHVYDYKLHYDFFICKLLNHYNRKNHDDRKITKM